MEKPVKVTSENKANDEGKMKEKIKVALEYVEKHPPCLDDGFQHELRKIGFRKLMKCPKCKTGMQLISIDTDKTPGKATMTAKYRYYCNKCKKARFMKLGEYE